MVWSRAMRRCVGLAEPCSEKFSSGQVQKRLVKSCSGKVRRGYVVSWYGDAWGSVAKVMLCCGIVQLGSVWQ